MKPDDFAERPRPHRTTRIPESFKSIYQVDSTKFLMIAIIVNSALYLTAVFVAALIYGNKPAMVFALFTMAMCYVGPSLQMYQPQNRVAALLVTGISIVFGGIAGALLIA